MATIIRTQPVTDDVVVVGLSCGHRLAMEGAPQDWPLGREYACQPCEHPEPYVTAVVGTAANRVNYTLFLSCGHYAQVNYHHRLDFMTVSKLVNTHQFCLSCAQIRTIP